MNYALIKSGAVVNTIVADQAFADAIASEWDAVIPLADDEPAGIGWAWDGTAFTAPPVPPAPPPTVPHSITPRQARIALSRAGKLDAVNAAIAAMSEQAGIEARLTWEFATEVQRSDPLIPQMASALSMTDADLDNLFTLAATL